MNWNVVGKSVGRPVYAINHYAITCMHACTNCMCMPACLDTSHGSMAAQIQVTVDTNEPGWSLSCLCVWPIEDVCTHTHTYLPYTCRMLVCLGFYNKEKEDTMPGTFSRLSTACRVFQGTDVSFACPNRDWLGWYIPFVHLKSSICTCWLSGSLGQAASHMGRWEAIRVD